MSSKPLSPGWYPSQTDSTIEVYWDGKGWSGQRARESADPQVPDGWTIGSGKREGQWFTGRAWVKQSKDGEWVPAEARGYSRKVLLSVIGIVVLLAAVVGVGAWDSNRRAQQRVLEEIKNQVKAGWSSSLTPDQRAQLCAADPEQTATDVLQIIDTTEVVEAGISESDLGAAVADSITEFCAR